MDAAADPSSGRSWWQRRNWWKIGFFVLLFVLEVCREIIVIQANPMPSIAANDYVGSFGGHTKATGRWQRTDGGSKLVPGATTIQCSQERGECLEVTAHWFDGYVGTPEIDTFPATFADDLISYRNDIPDCAVYTVRIDLALKKVFAVRQRKTNPGNPMCAKLEERVEMTLGRGFQPSDRNVNEHFLPVVNTLMYLFNNGQRAD